MLKPYLGFEAFVGPLAAIVDGFAAELGACGIDVVRMRASLGTIAALEAERVVRARELALVESTLFAEKSRTWTDMLAIYARAKPAARFNCALRAAIEPFQRFMSTGRRAKK